MASEKKDLIDRLSELPKGKLIALAAVFFVVVGFLAVYFGFGLYKKPVEEQTETVVLDVADAVVEDRDRTRLETYQDADMAARTEKVRDSYWDMLGGEKSKTAPGGEDYLDPAVYSSGEIYLITHGLKTRQEIDQEHAAEAARKALEGQQAAAAAAQQQPLTQAQRDSAYFSRMEKAYQLAAKYAAPASQEEPVKEEPKEEPKEEERKIDLADKSANLPTDSFEGDGIVTSLVGPDESDVVHYAGTTRSKPVKATFLKNETISDGQRVIIRLMQDLTLTDGTMIPANTHITGTCHFGSRLKIDVKMLHYNGRMFPTDISVYDNDGTEGIYCPTVENSRKKKRAAKQTASDAISGVGTVIGSALTGNPFVGRVAASGLSSATSFINDDGTVSVKVTSGYEFYVFENYDEKKQKQNQ